jgi:dihydroxyacetone kinase-like predicted kinase
LELVAKGSVIALKEGVVLFFGSDLTEVALKAILDTVVDSSELITLVTGDDVPEDLAANLAARITQAIPSIEVTTYSGGQAWYPLLIGIE